MKYKIITADDTGDAQWNDYYYIYADSDEKAKVEASDLWIENRLGAAVVSADLYCPNGHIIKSFR